MKVAVKYLLLILGVVAALYSFQKGFTGAGITAAGAFIAFALIEIEDLRILNNKDEI